MKALVTYAENNQIEMTTVEAEDMETIKKSVNQWRVSELRRYNRHIEILSIRENPFDLGVIR